jgi:hypothetical protein
MKITIEKFDHRVHRLYFNMPYDLKTLVHELEQEHWNPYGMETAVEHNLWSGKRFKLHHPQSPIIREISEYFARPEVREYVVEQLYLHDPMFSVNWQMYPWRMIENTELHAEWTKDLPGFECGIHCDMRRLVATGMIYLTPYDSEEWCSYFYQNPNREDPVRVPADYSTGWIHANSWNTWHDGWNRSDQVRYSMLLGLTLRLEHQPQASDNPHRLV